MSFSIGIVGLPNVGKSTLFKALTKCSVDVQNYPFCTINPNVGVVKVPDERLYTLAKISNSAQVIHTTIEFVDIAGLVAGAHKGEGLGNQFLANIREVDAIAQVVRGFPNSDIIHVHGKVDPDEDVSVINSELILADLESVTKRMERMGPQMRSPNVDKVCKRQFELYEKIKDGLQKGVLANKIIIGDDEKALLADLNLLTAKPFLYIFNISEAQLGTVHSLMGVPQDSIVPICAKTESELADLPEDEARELLDALGMKQSGLDQVISAAYRLLGLITFFTSGPKETRAWTVTAGTKAPQAAGKIHTDFEKAFIRAEVTAYADYVRCAGEQGAKDSGVYRLEGKDYVVQDGDVIYFRVGV